MTFSDQPKSSVSPSEEDALPSRPRSVAFERSSFPTVGSDRIFGALEAATGNALWVQVVVQFDGHLDEALLARALRALIDRNPYLGCRFDQAFWSPRWRRIANLSINQVLEVRENADPHAGLQEALITSPDDGRSCAVKVLLVRGKADTLCLKLDHKLGDGQSAKELVYELAETYSALGREEPCPHSPMESCDRSLRQIVTGLSATQNRALLAKVRAATPLASDASSWRLPPPLPQSDSELVNSEFIMTTLQRDTVAAVLNYGMKLRATMSQVLSASFAVAAMHTVPRNSGVPCILQTVDLRRYLPSKRTNLPCNFAGLLPLSINLAPVEPFHLHVASIRDQVALARGGFIGLSLKAMRWEFVAWRKVVLRCIPYRLFVRAARRRDHRARAAKKGGLLVFTDIGPIDRTRLNFENHRPAQAFVTSGTVMIEKLLLFCVTEFDGTVTASVGFSPRLISRSTMRALMDTFRNTLESEIAVRPA